MDDDPVSYWSIHLIVILSKDLARSIQAKPCLPFVYLLGEDMVLVLHLPDSCEDSCPLWDLASSLVDGNGLDINLSIQLFLHALD